MCIQEEDGILSEQEDRTCKRCSVARVNALVEAYAQAHAEANGNRLSRLKQIHGLCKSRGFDQGRLLLQPNLSEKQVRALCWNVSSFLQNAEVEAILNVKLR